MIPTICSALLYIVHQDLLYVVLWGRMRHLLEHQQVHKNDCLIGAFGLVDLVAKAPKAGHDTATRIQLLVYHRSVEFSSTYSEPKAKRRDRRIFLLFAFCHLQSPNCRDRYDEDHQIRENVNDGSADKDRVLVQTFASFDYRSWFTNTLQGYR